MGYSFREGCELLALLHRSFYYKSTAGHDEQLEADLKTKSGKHTTYGTLRLIYHLRRAPYGYDINRKRKQQLARQKGLLRPQKAPKT